MIKQISEDLKVDEVLRTTCESFIRNRDALRESFRYEGMAMHLMGAAVMSSADDKIEVADYKKCEEFLDSKTGVFSPLRGLLKMPMVINLALSSDRDDYYERVQNVYEDIIESRNSKDERLLLAAMIIASSTKNPDVISDLIETAGRIYNKTDAAGRLFSDMSAYVTAAGVAVSGVRDVMAYSEELELCKEELAEPSGIGVVPEELCMLLAAEDGDAKDKCDRVKEISAALGAKKIGLGSGSAAAMLAALSSLDMTPDEIAEKVSEADKFLKEQKGFGFMGTGAATRHMYAAMLVCIAYVSDSRAAEIGSGAAVNDAITNRYVASAMLSQQGMLQTQMMLLSQTANPIV